MDLSTITVADFKALFRKDFPYLPVYDAATLYNAGRRVYYPTTQLFYDCKNNGTINVLPTVTASWAVTDPQPDVDSYVQDIDITRAFAEAMVTFNQALLTSNANIQMAFLYLAAHYLVNDFRAAMGGLSGSGAYPVSSRSVGSVSEAYSIPAEYLENPAYAYLAGSAYGMKYLSMLWPMLVGNVVAVQGWTHP